MIIDTPQARVELSAQLANTAPGTRFAVLRVTSQRDGGSRRALRPVQNLGRVRVVVSALGRK